MNETTEIQLRSWAPRRPSARLEAKLFSPKAAPAPTLSPRVHLSWLVPAASALFLFGVVFNHHNGQLLPGVSGTNPIVALVSNQSTEAWFPGSIAQTQKPGPSSTFEWTNGSGSTSSVDSPFGSQRLR
jgi:hypothetical protein